MDDTEQGELIELRVEHVAQLFHTLDPFPFRERDLDREAEEFIVGWARELPVGRPISIVVHLPEIETKASVADELNEAFRRYFSDRSSAVQSEIKELFRIGRRSLWIGISILVACLLASHLAAGYLIESPFRRLVEESFLILGWVANWRPLEIFLYDWLPLVRNRDLYRRLAAAKLDLKSYTAPKLSNP
jgi:ABC-type spermidine/putrescine transport system permease subunit I